ncbi:akirin-2-like [Rhopilema esculentum]|uniref:akirin-2-like n=1 Tax=Rhopilema esculentum TaxID=499914 RepID=UPI0031E141DF
MACATLKRSYDFDPLMSPTQRSPKRRRCGPPVVSSPVQTADPSSSPFHQRTPKISSDELSASVLEEWKRIQKRQKLASSMSPPQNDQYQHHKMFQLQNPAPQFNMPSFNFNSPGSYPAPAFTENKSSKEQPMFTAKQVVMLCERLWKEREEKLKEEYDQVLHERLSEQYNSFLRFTQDQIVRQYSEPSCSYVS